jgi:hypothetical protein
METPKSGGGKFWQRADQLRRAAGESNTEELFVDLRKKTESLIRRNMPPPASNAAMSTSTWTKMAKAIVEASVSGSPTALTGASFDLLMSLVGVRDEQSKLLQSIDRQVGLLRAGPFTAGRLRLEEAARVRDDAVRAHTFLDEARQQFYDAHGLAASSHERGIIETHLGVVYYLLGRSEDSRYWFTRAHASLSELTSQLSRDAGNIRVLRTRSSVAITSTLFASTVGPAVLAAKIRKVWQSERALQALAQLIPLVNAVAQSATAVGGQGLISYRLISDGEGWALQQY